MGTGKKEAVRKERQGKVGDGMSNVKVKGENFYRYAITILLSSKRVRYRDLTQLLICVSGRPRK